jgi:hypothetical protein
MDTTANLTTLASSRKQKMTSPKSADAQQSLRDTDDQPEGYFVKKTASHCQSGRLTGA